MLLRPDALCGSDLIHADFSRHAFAPHTHERWTIGYLEHGANQFRRGRTQWTASQGMVCVVNPGEVHTGGGAAMRYWDLMPSPALLQRLFPHTAHETLFMRDAVLSGGAAVDAIGRMFGAFAAGHCALACEQAVVDGLTTLFTTQASLHAEDVRSDPAPRAVAIAIEYIEAHLAASIALADVAAAADLSLFHFCRVFEKARHISPAAWVRNRRVERARILIGQGVPLADAAARAGFADQAHMTRQFRAILGATPARWRT